jgi:hypothetical protein
VVTAEGVSPAQPVRNWRLRYIKEKHTMMKKPSQIRTSKSRLTPPTSLRGIRRRAHTKQAEALLRLAEDLRQVSVDLRKDADRIFPSTFHSFRPE